MIVTDDLDVGLVGATLAGRYEVLERLGRGGMGEVYRALDRELDDEVALKVVHGGVADVPGVLDRFRAEVKLARRVTHRNVARTFELGHADGLLFFTMELVRGSSLAARLRRGSLAPAQAIAIAAELCDALTAAHGAGVIHRDLKPDNVMLADDGRVVLTDFGVASFAAITDGTASGSPAYMAPEQARGEPATPLVDVYALGLVLYELLTGEPAFAGGLGTVLAAKQEPAFRPPALAALEPALAAIVARAIAPEPSARWPSAAALRRALAPEAPAAEAAPALPSATWVRGLPTVQVLPAQAPREQVAFVLGLQDELLRRLARRDHLRLARGRERALDDGAWVRVSGHADGAARVTVRQPGRRDHLELHVALDVDALVAGAELASRVIASMVGAGRDRGPDDEPMPAAARAHLWRAVERTRDPDVERALADDAFAAAAALAGDHPRVMAGLAMSHVRQAFFSDPPLPAQLARATELATRAIAAAPHAAEAHVAYGRVLLHQGDATGATVHLRTALARAPYLTEPHEWLGRLLLEAGFLAEGMARMHDALEMDPELQPPRWGLARAHALEGRWDLHDIVVRELGQGPDAAVRLAFTMRTAAWRGDRELLARIRAATTRLSSLPWFERALIEAMTDAALAGRWYAIREQVVARVTTTPDQDSARRRAFTSQIVTEVAAGAGDLDVAFLMLARSVEAGLFDRHWLERCPLLAAVRTDPRYPPLHAVVAARAHAILDAYYGDVVARGADDTVLVTDRR